MIPTFSMLLCSKWCFVAASRLQQSVSRYDQVKAAELQVIRINAGFSWWANSHNTSHLSHK